MPPFKQGCVEHERLSCSQKVPLVPITHLQVAGQDVKEQLVVDDIH